MVTASEIRTDVDGIIDEFGEPCLITRFSAVYSGTEYDTEYLSATGSTWVTCLNQPFSLTGNGRNSSEVRYIEEGREADIDRVLYFAGSVTIDGNSKLGLGSPTITQYQILADGIINFSVANSPVYRKAFVRTLNNGSWINQI